jgi:MraZ protein
MPAETSSAPIFSGEFRHGLDGKNRVTIPSRWRQSEADEFFLMPDRTNMFLRAMPPAQFRAVADKVANNPAVTEKDKAIFLRHFYSRSQHAVMDKQGRIVLPEEFCEKLHLRGEIVLVGAHDKFELWNREAWDAVAQMEAGTFDRVAELAGL